MIELEQLRELVFNSGFDESSKQDVLYYEQKLNELSVKENILQHQPVKEWFDYLERDVKNARLLLSTDPTLEEKKRTELFLRIEIANKYLSLLDISDKEKLEEEIKNALDVAKAQNDI
jgi:hypothetical protein